MYTTPHGLRVCSAFLQLCVTGYGISDGECVPCDETSFVKFTNAGIVIVIFVILLVSYVGFKYVKNKCCPTVVPQDVDDGGTVSTGTVGTSAPRKKPAGLFQQANVIVKLKIALTFLQVPWGVKPRGLHQRRRTRV